MGESGTLANVLVQGGRAVGTLGHEEELRKLRKALVPKKVCAGCMRVCEGRRQDALAHTNIRPQWTCTCSCCARWALERHSAAALRRWATASFRLR